jgi:hypothetical protein
MAGSGAFPLAQWLTTGPQENAKRLPDDAYRCGGSAGLATQVAHRLPVSAFQLAPEGHPNVADSTSQVLRLSRFFHRNLNGVLTTAKYFDYKRNGLP